MSTGSLDDVLTPGDVEAFFDDLAHLAADTLSAIGPRVVCGVTIERGETQTTVASSSPRASLLDEIQYEVDRGPCLESLRSREVVHIPDLETADMWPMWRARALGAGVMSSLSVPVVGLADGSGGCAFNFYAEEKDAFSTASLARAHEYAQRAVRGVAVGLRLVESERSTEHLRAALGSRSVIDQALGILMAEQRCSADEAFRVLRRASHNRNVKLKVVAAEIVERVTGTTPPPWPAFTGAVAPRPQFRPGRGAVDNG